MPRDQRPLLRNQSADCAGLPQPGRTSFRPKVYIKTQPGAAADESRELAERRDVPARIGRPPSRTATRGCSRRAASYAEAEAAYRRAQALTARRACAEVAVVADPSRRLAAFEVDDRYSLAAVEGRMKARAGPARGSRGRRYAARLLSRLKTVGKYHPTPRRSSVCLSRAAGREQARFAEAEKMARTTVEIYRTLELSRGDAAPCIRVEPARHQPVQTQRRSDEAARSTRGSTSPPRIGEQPRADRHPAELVAHLHRLS